MSGASLNFSKLTPLVVDDSVFMLNLIDSILRSYGCREVIQAASVDKGEKALARHDIDFAFVDWHMEPVEGLEFVRRVRDGDAGSNPYLPMVMLTGHGEVDRIRLARDAGVNGFLVKPVSGESVYRHIVALVDDTRPFIRTRTFLGPDRRRVDVGPPKGMKDRRRNSRVL